MDVTRRILRFVQRHNILAQLSVLVFTLWSLSAYNYVSQKKVFLEQLQDDSSGLLKAVISSITRFNTIQQTLSLQALVEEISLELDIFEFRFLDENGIVIGSMFPEEVGERVSRPGVERALSDPGHLGEYYPEERDYTQVLAISYPVFDRESFLGIIDLAVDIGALDFVDAAVGDQLLQRIRIDVGNLLNAIAGSVVSRNKVFTTVDLNGFLGNLVNDNDNLVEISVVDRQGGLVGSSEPRYYGQHWRSVELDAKGLLLNEDKALFMVSGTLHGLDGIASEVVLYLDASQYVANERKLFYTAVATNLLGIIFAIGIVYAIYRINLRRAREENIRLEYMVRERTAEIERISKTDKLTGLSSRCALEEQLDMEYKRARRYGHDLSLIVVDLDHFKNVNDSFGHLAGDAVLREIGHRLRQQLRETDFIGRYGGEEFVVLLPETTAQDALDIAELLRRTVASDPVIVDGVALSVTASLGVADLNAGHGSYKTLFADADGALYHSKSCGRNRITYFDGAARQAYP